MKKLISLGLTLALSLSLAVPALAEERESPFGDVSPRHWAFGSICQAYEEHVVSGVGYDQETDKPLFAPDNTLTAAEFATMVTQAFYWREFRQESDETGPEQAGLEAAYPGVEPWYAIYARTAERAGLAEGTGIEDWSAPMTRYQMAQMLYNIAVGQSLFVTPDEETLEPVTIGDWDQVPEEYQRSVAAAYALGLLSGVDEAGTFAGTRTLTRSQAAVVYCRLEDALLALQGPMERVLEKAERQMAVWGTPSYEFTRYPGLKGTLYVGVYLGTPHGSSTNMVFVYEDGGELSIRALLPGGYRLGDYLSPTEIQFDETGEKLIFITPVEEGTPNPNPGPDDPRMWLETKDWGPTRCTVDLASGTMESMIPLESGEPDQPSEPEDGSRSRELLFMEATVTVNAEGMRSDSCELSLPWKEMWVSWDDRSVSVGHSDTVLRGPAFAGSGYGQAIQTLKALDLPVGGEGEDTPEQRERAGACFQVRWNGKPVSGSLCWPEETELRFVFDEPISTESGGVLTLWIGMPQET